MSFTHPLLLSPKPSLCAGWRTVGLLRLQPPPLSAPLAWLRPLLATSLRCGALNLRGRRPSMVPGSRCWSSALVFEPVRGVADSRASQAPASTLVRSPRQAVSPALPRRCAAELSTFGVAAPVWSLARAAGLLLHSSSSLVCTRVADTWASLAPASTLCPLPPPLLPPEPLRRSASPGLRDL